MQCVREFSEAGIWFELREGNKLRFGPVIKLTPQIRSAVREHKQDIIRELRQADFSYLLQPLPMELRRFNPTLQEMTALLGDEWEKTADDPYLLAQWVHTIRVNKMVEAGVVPPGFVHKARCHRCGDIVLDFRVSCELAACPWCFSLSRPVFNS